MKMRHISKTLGKNYRYTASKKYKEYQHKRTCLKTKRNNARYLEIQQLRDELLSRDAITLNEFNDVIQKIYDTVPPDKQDRIIEKILEGRLFLAKK